MNARRSLYILSVAVLLLMLAVAGCNRARNDAQIAGDVVTKIQSDANIPTKQITVTSNNGVVTLAGNVTSDMERAAAANDAAQVEGVKTVVNNLQVAGTSTAAAEPQPAPEQVQPEPAPAPAARTRRVARQISKPSPSMASAPVAAPAVTSTASSPMAAAPLPPPAPLRPVTIPSGTPLSVRMLDPVDTARNKPGDSFRATLDSPITIDDKVIVPQGADIQGRVAELKSGGKFAGQPELALELTSISVNGRRYTIETNQYSRQGASRGKNTAAKVGGGAAVGAIIGAIAGGGKGAAIGSVIGAGAGGGVQAASKAPTVQVPSEALLSFRLESPITVTPSASSGRTRSTSASEYTDSQPEQQFPDDNGPILKRRSE